MIAIDYFWIHFVLYWSVGGLFTLFDLCGVSSNFLQKYRWHTRTPPRWGTLLVDAASVLFNQFIVTLPLGMLAHKWFSNNIGTDMSWSGYAGYFLGLLFIEEALFYYSHRLLHTKWFYDKVHYWHHRYVEPVALMAISAHPVEHLLSNVLPLVVGPIVLQTPCRVTKLWIAIATVNGILAHCGYHLGFKVKGGSHDLHHRFRTGNYGVIGLFDYLHGTRLDLKYSGTDSPVL